MASDESPKQEATEAGPQPLSPAVRHRLQQLFEHATRSAEKHDFDYANDLFTQCVVGDPGNIVYLQSFLANLQNKYKNNKKGSKLAGLKTSAARKTLKAAAAKEDWRGAISAGCDILKMQPWDSPTLIAMSHACREMEIDECQLYYLRWALNANPKDPEVNKQAGLALAKMGQFDQAIVCWHRVEEAKPGNEEAAKAIAHLTVEKTIHQGGYNREDLGQYGGKSDAPSGIRSKSSTAATTKTPPPNADDEPARDSDTEPESEPAEPIPADERLRKAIEDAPAEIANYLDLSDHYLRHHQFDEADAVLNQALAVSGGGHLGVRERIEDLQLARCRRQLEIARKRAAEDDSEDAQELARRFKAELNQQELEIFAARSERNPQSLQLKFEVGLRLKRAGKYEDAIKAFQSARDDTKRKAQVYLELGECFQKIEQYKLAMSNYERAIDEVGNDQSEIRHLALYRAGVLATGLRDLDKAEQHLTELAGIDFGYRDVATRLDKVNRLRNNG